MHIARRRRRARRARRACASASSIRSTSSASSRPRTRRVAGRERGQQQRAVGDALRPGQRDRACGARDRRKVERGGSAHRRGVAIASGLARAVGRRRRRRRRCCAHPTRGARRARARTPPRAPRRRRRRASRRRDRAARESAPISASSASRLASAMSRHISGELAAMRVKSRKPLAAKRKSVVGVGPRGELVDEREREHVRQMRDRGEDRGRAPRHRACARARRRSATAAATVASAQRIGFRQRRQHDVAIGDRASRTRPRRPNARCPRSDAPGRSAATRRPSAARAAAITSCLVLPASVTIVCGPRRGAIARSSAGYCATGAASSTTSAVASSRRPVVVERTRSGRRCRGRRASSRLTRPRPTPTTVPDAAGGLQRERERAADQARRR